MRQESKDTTRKRIPLQDVLQWGPFQFLRYLWRKANRTYGQIGTRVLLECSVAQPSQLRK